MSNMVSTKEAAQALGITTRRVLALIKSGRLPAVKVGRDWVLSKDDLKLIKNRPPGRPKKNA